MKETKAKSEAIRRAANQCEGCRVSGNRIQLEAHHKRYDKDSDDWDPADFAILCMTCHDLITIVTRLLKTEILPAKLRGIIRTTLKKGLTEHFPQEWIECAMKGPPGGYPDWRWEDSESERIEISQQEKRTMPAKKQKHIRLEKTDEARGVKISKPVRDIRLSDYVSD